MIELHAPAKLNLYLDVIDKRPDGYHNIVSIMQTIGLYDIIRLEAAEGISLSCPALDLPAESNLAYKAALLLQEYISQGAIREDTQTGMSVARGQTLSVLREQIQAGVSVLRQGASIHVDKHIPSGAGLGGGSSDAAGVLLGLNQLWNLGLSTQQLMQIGERLGADVPFFIIGGTCLAEGIGTKITPLPPLLRGEGRGEGSTPPLLRGEGRGEGGVWFVVVYPKVNISTAGVYKNIKFELTNQTKTVKIIMDGLRNSDIIAIAEGLYNRLEDVTLNHYPQIKAIKDELMDAGCLAALMSGSGSCVFGITRSREEADNVSHKIQRGDRDVFVAASV